jgi:hypothetical protein
MISTKNKRYGENASKQVKITSQKTEYFAKTANTYGTLLELWLKR